jgi:hypothetical protein
MFLLHDLRTSEIILYMFECGHPVVFILKHLITYNSVNTTQNVNIFIATCFNSLESSSGYD